MEAAEVADLIAAAKESPARVIAECNARLARSTSPQDFAVCLRARSIAERTLGDFDCSSETARAAITHAQAASLDTEAGLAWGTLGATLLYCGEMTEARHALETGRELVTGGARLQLDMHLAGLLGRTGEVDAARSLLHQVAEAALDLEQVELGADALANRGTFAGYSGHLAEAEADLNRARTLYASLGQRVAEAQMTHNLGWIASLRGDLQSALEAYGEATTGLDGFDFWENAVHLANRAEAKLNAGLFTEASVDAAAAATLFGEHGAHTDEAEAYLVGAHACLAAGDRIAAQHAADQADRLFAEQNRSGWLAEAQLVAARASNDTHPDVLRELAARLVAAGQRTAAIDAWLAAAHMGAVECLELVGDPKKLPWPQATRYDEARARSLIRGGHRGRALDTIRSRLEASAEVRATIASTDVRAGLAAVLNDLRDLGVASCLKDGDVNGLFEFAEWGSLALVEPPPVKTSTVPELDLALTSLRSLNSALRSTQREFGDVGDLPAQVTKAERAVVDLGRQERRQHPHAPVRPTPLPAVQEALVATDRATLCRFVTSEGHLIRIDVSSEMCTVTECGPIAAVDEITGLQAALERCLVGSSSQRAQRLAEQTLDELLAQLDQLAFGDLDSASPMIVVPVSPLSGVPWSLLPSRRGTITSVMPAASFVTTAAVPTARVAGSTPMLAVAGPGLSHATAEARLVAELYSDATVLVGESATVDATINSLAGAECVHLGAHGHLRPEQPLLSAIELSDGGATISDLHRVTPPPRVVVIATCSSARAITTDGGELFGIAAILMAAGATSVIGCPVSLPDDAETTAVMLAIHQRLAVGDTPARAVATAASVLEGRARLIAHSLVVFGPLDAQRGTGVPTNQAGDRWLGLC